MFKFRLTLFAKILVIIILISILSIFSYFLSCIHIVTNTNKLILNNNELILDNGIYFYKPNKVTKISNFPTPYNKKELPDDLSNLQNIYITKDIPLELQLNNGEIYKCNYFIASTFDKNWVIQYKEAPIFTIPQYSLNSYILDHVGNFSSEYLFKATTKAELEKLIKDWLIKNTKNHGIIIILVKINTVFSPVKF